MGVAVEEGAARLQRRQVAGVPQVAVGEPEGAAARVDDLGVVGHAGEVEDHLVHLGLAVAAHGHDGRREGVEHGDDALGVVVAGQRVARSVVEDVAEDQDLVGPLGLDALHQAAAPVGGAVDVAGDEVLHGRS